jgi:pilus assembly protein Flp/PilA
MKNLLARLWNEESGQDLVEYGLLIALVGVAAIASMQTIASAVSTEFAAAATNMTTS